MKQHLRNFAPLGRIHAKEILYRNGMKILRPGDRQVYIHNAYFVFSVNIFKEDIHKRKKNVA